MKFTPHIPGRSCRRNNLGFSIVEMMVAAWAYIIIFLGVMFAIQMFAARVYTLAATKIAATSSSLKTLNAVVQQIRMAETVDVGQCTLTPASFNSLTSSNSQIGNALRIYPSTDPNNYSIFYLDSTAADCNLQQFTVSTNGLNGDLSVHFITNTFLLASYITNQNAFTAEDYQGNILTNDQSAANRLVIHMKLQFYQWEYPVAFVGTAGLNAYDFYQLETRVTRRTDN